MDRNKGLTFFSKLGQIYSVSFLRFIKKKKKIHEWGWGHGMEGSCQVSWSLDYLLGDKPEKAFFNVDEAKPNIPWQKKKKKEIL